MPPTVQSRTFLNEPGIVPAYSGVENTTASAAAIRARRSATGGGSGSWSSSGLKWGRAPRPSYTSASARPGPAASDANVSRAAVFVEPSRRLPLTRRRRGRTGGPAGTRPGSDRDRAAHAAPGLGAVAGDLGADVERGGTALAAGLELLGQVLGRHDPGDLELDAVRVLCVQGLRAEVVGRPDEGPALGQHAREALQLGQRVDLPGQVVEANHAPPCRGRRCVGADLERAEVVVVGGAGGLEEGHRAVDEGQRPEAEDVLVELAGRGHVAHVEDGVVQAGDGHGALGRRRGSLLSTRTAPAGIPVRCRPGIHTAGGIAMTYAGERRVVDADSHLMETPR